jgi:hypothetical protein
VAAMPCSRSALSSVMMSRIFAPLVGRLYSRVLALDAA